MDDKGYVIRKVDEFDGSIWFRGIHNIYNRDKDAILPRDTYSLSGAKRALANIQRLYPTDFYSIEKLSCYYISHDNEQKNKGMNRQKINEGIEHAMDRLDELWNGNNLDRGSKMRINEIRDVLRDIKSEIYKEEKTKKRRLVTGTIK